MKNLQGLEIKYLGATNTKGSRVKITDRRFNVSKTLKNNYEKSLIKQVEEYLSKIGFNIVGIYDAGENKDIVLVDNFTSLKVMINQS